MKYIHKSIGEHIELAQSLFLMSELIAQAAEMCRRSLADGGKIMLAGNGGSAADAQHIAAEFVGRFVSDRPSLPAIALTTDTSALTAIANDYGYEMVFARQIAGLGNLNDVFIAISTSGNSPNIIKAVETARAMGIFTIGWLGREGGKLASLVNLPLIVPSQTTARIQEMHILIGHLICEYFE